MPTTGTIRFKLLAEFTDPNWRLRTEWIEAPNGILDVGAILLPYQKKAVRLEFAESHFEAKEISTIYVGIKALTSGFDETAILFQNEPSVDFRYIAKAGEPDLCDVT